MKHSFKWEHDGDVILRASDGAEYLQLYMNSSNAILRSQDSTGPSLIFQTDSAQIGAIYADSDDLNIKCDQSNDKLNLMASTNVIFSIVNEGTGHANANAALTFTANDNTSISSFTLQTGGKSVIRWHRTVTGSSIVVENISGSKDGQFLVVVNDSNDNLGFVNEANALSTKIFTIDGGTVTIQPEGAAFFMYNNDLAGWCMIAGSRIL